MSAMCQLCGVDETIAEGDNPWKIPLCKKCEQKNAASPTTISPSHSLSSYGSCLSSYDDLQADAIPQKRGYGTDDLDTGQSHSNPELVEEHMNGSLLKGTNVENSNANSFFYGPAPPMSAEKNYRSYLLALKDCKGGSNERTENHRLAEGEPTTDGDDSDEEDNAVSKISFISNDKNDPIIWIPPEPEDMEHDMDSVANNDDDDDYNNDTWGQPSSLSSLDELGKHSSYKEERKKAMLEAMNGQFKILVSELLASEGTGISAREDCENWLDIVTSLTWEAASLIKPDANEGIAMDPGSYLKVKCIASGSRNQSQVIRGLVFKKNIRQKQMPTTFKNPRLLLIKGSVGHSAVGLSSLKSMEQENDYKKSFIEMIDSCHPNVVLVEKSVSGDIQGSLRDRGITLIPDMKLPRLERIARCTGSQIISSSDILGRPKLTQCDSFHIEKIVEEHNGIVECGTKPSKTLMFLEGCPRPLGCTILLRGAPVDELKRVKCVVQYTVFAAYHLILETSFFADQRTFFYNKDAVKGRNCSSRNKPVASESNTTPLSSNLQATVNISPLQALDIPITNGSIRRSVDDGMKVAPNQDTGRSFLMPASAPLSPSIGDDIHSTDLYGCPDGDENIISDLSIQALGAGQLMSSVSVLTKFLCENVASLTAERISSCSSINNKMANSGSTGNLISPIPVTFDHGIEENTKINQEGSDDGMSRGEKAGEESGHNETSEQCSEISSTAVHIEGKHDIEGALDSQSILVLLSSYCIPKQTVCEQTHFSRIKYYGNFDMSLGRYLQEILLGQKSSCSFCDQPPEDHVYRYTHQNGSLTVLVRRLPREFTLSGEAEGKIWMWTQCLKCMHERGNSKPTRRVVLSSAARGFSFGKFLELSFSSHSSARRLSRCGHLLHRDCLRFFGLGSKVAMFQYTSVEIYAACMPPPKLEFCDPSKPEWFLREAREVLSRGDLVFREIADMLKKLKPKPTNSVLEHSTNVSGPVIEFDEVEKRLMREKSEFEASLRRATDHASRMQSVNHEILDLNWAMQELQFMVYIWDRRLHSIFLRAKEGETSNHAVDEQLHEKNGAISHGKPLPRSPSEGPHEVLESFSHVPIEVEDMPFVGNCEAENYASLKNNFQTEPSEVSKRPFSSSYELMTQGQSHNVESSPSSVCQKSEEECIPIGEDHITQGDNSVPILVEPKEPLGRAIDVEPVAEWALQKAGALECQKSEDIRLDDPNWIWAPFSRLTKALRQDLRGGSLQKFEFISSYSPTYLSPMRQLSSQVTDSLHFPVGSGGNMISVIEEEISTIIGCALALSDENQVSFDKTIGNEGRDGKAETNANDCSLSSTPISSVPSVDGSSTGLVHAEKIKMSRSFPSLSSEELAAFASDGSLFTDGLAPMENLHPEIPLGCGKISGKSKYSVVCVYAKEFRSLRQRCCSSEMAYISSLSRCRQWDAQGGKSKAVFVKTMDDRFIIKQIKKTELESFLKFGSDYFKHINLSLDSGSQTCLAKILGIYQVRQLKNGKEVKIDVVVMENIFFGRNISRKYDLKGALFSRYISNSNDSERVFLDENFIEDMRISPLYIGGKNKHLLQRAIWNDTSFLTSINVMDYSLLVGVDREKHEIVFGIIDYLRQYTWDKQLETWVKASLVVPRNELPTVISPKEYKKRFRKFMAKYFLMVPDTWNPPDSSESRKFCHDSQNVHGGKTSEK